MILWLIPGSWNSPRTEALSGAGLAAGTRAPIAAPLCGSMGLVVAFIPPPPQAALISPATARNETRAKQNVLRMLTRAPPLLGCRLDEPRRRGVPARSRSEIGRASGRER